MPRNEILNTNKWELQSNRLPHSNTNTEPISKKRHKANSRSAFKLVDINCLKDD